MDLETSKADAAEKEETDLETEERENSKLKAESSCQDGVGGGVCVFRAGSLLGQFVFQPFPLLIPFPSPDWSCLCLLLGGLFDLAVGFSFRPLAVSTTASCSRRRPWQ